MNKLACWFKWSQIPTIIKRTVVLTFSIIDISVQMANYGRLNSQVGLVYIWTLSGLSSRVGYPAPSLATVRILRPWLQGTNHLLGPEFLFFFVLAAFRALMEVLCWFSSAGQHLCCRKIKKFWAQGWARPQDRRTRLRRYRQSVYWASGRMFLLRGMKLNIILGRSHDTEVAISLLIQLP